MTDRARSERLQTQIELKRAALAEERATLAKLQSEVDLFARQYDRIIGPLEQQLDSIRQEIESLQTAVTIDHESIWGPGFNSFEESFDAKYRRPTDGPKRSGQSAPVDE